MITPYFSDNEYFIFYQSDTNCVLTEIKDKVDVVFAYPPYFHFDNTKSIPYKKITKSQRIG